MRDDGYTYEHYLHWEDNFPSEPRIYKASQDGVIYTLEFDSGWIPYMLEGDSATKTCLGKACDWAEQARMPCNRMAWEKARLAKGRSID